MSKNAETIEDLKLLKKTDRAYFRAFKKWSRNLSWNEGYVWKYLLITLIIIGIGLVSGFFDGFFTGLFGLGDSDISLNFISTFAGSLLGIGLLGFSLNIAKGIESELSHFWKSITWERIWKCLLAGILYGLIVFGGMILLIIPGIIFSIRFQFFNCAIIDKGMGPIDALKYSRRITKGRLWECFLFDLYFCLINLLGVLCLFVGIILTAPMTKMAKARYYYLISHLYDESDKNNK